MKFGPRGRSTSTAEVTNVSSHGFWLLVAKRELYVPFKLFPWFKNATIAELVNVKIFRGEHLHWPDLDADLSIECIEHPERFPLVDRRHEYVSKRRNGVRQRVGVPRRTRPSARRPQPSRH